MNRIQIYLSISIILLMAKFSFAQENLTLYNMQAIQQSNYQNPGKLPSAKLNISLPIIASTSVGYLNNGFILTDLISKKGGKGDSLLLTSDNMLSKLSNSNLLAVSLSTEIFGIGIRKKNNYFSFNAMLKSEDNITFSKDLMTFIFKGNTAFFDKDANISLKVNSNTYTEYSFGFTHQTKNEKLTYGTRLKLLSGLFCINSQRTNLAINTNSKDYSIQTTPDILINTSLVDTGDVSFSNIGSNMFGPNKGVGLDLGVTYKLTDKISLSASVIDLGFIKWKDKVANYYSNPNGKGFGFEGFDPKQFFGSTNPQDYLNNLSDSFRHTMYPLKSKNSFKTSLPTKIFLAANYKINGTFNAGALLYGKIVNQKLYSSIALSLNEAIGKWLNISESYSMANRTHNFGLGFSINVAPFQIYAVSDNIFSVYKMESTHNTNFHMGLNLYFGRKKE